MSCEHDHHDHTSHAHHHAQHAEHVHNAECGCIEAQEHSLCGRGLCDHIEHRRAAMANSDLQDAVQKHNMEDRITAETSSAKAKKTSSRTKEPTHTKKFRAQSLSELLIKQLSAREQIA